MSVKNKFKKIATAGFALVALSFSIQAFAQEGENGGGYTFLNAPQPPAPTAHALSYQTITPDLIVQAYQDIAAAGGILTGSDLAVMNLMKSWDYQSKYFVLGSMYNSLFPGLLMSPDPNLTANARQAALDGMNAWSLYLNAAGDRSAIETQTALRSMRAFSDYLSTGVYIISDSDAVERLWIAPYMGGVNQVYVLTESGYFIYGATDLVSYDPFNLQIHNFSNYYLNPQTSTITITTSPNPTHGTVTVSDGIDVNTGEVVAPGGTYNLGNDSVGDVEGGGSGGGGGSDPFAHDEE